MAEDLRAGDHVRLVDPLEEEHEEGVVTYVGDDHARIRWDRFPGQARFFDLDGLSTLDILDRIPDLTNPDAVQEWLDA